MWADPMRTDTRLHERDNFSLKPSEIRIYGENTKEQQDDLKQSEQPVSGSSRQGTIQV